MPNAAPGAIAADWHSPDGVANAIAVRANYSALFTAMAEVDAYGHRLLSRLGDQEVSSLDLLVAIALTRRLVTQYVGARTLCEASVVDQAKLPARAIFEVTLAVHYMLFGAKKRVTMATQSNAAQRVRRANYYYVAAERRDLYARKLLLDGRFGGSPVAKEDRPRLQKEFDDILSQLNRDYPYQQKAFGDLRCLNPIKSKRSYFDKRPWYSFGFRKAKVSSVFALAARLGYLSQYNLLYAGLSGVTHPSGIGHDVTVKGKQVEVHHPHTPEGLELIAFWASSWQMLSLGWLNRTFHPASMTDMSKVQKRVYAVLIGLEAALPRSFL